MTELPKMLMTIGAVLLIIGAIMHLVGRLPGDFTWKKGNVTFYFPIMTSIIVSIVLTLLFTIISRFK
ncbi:DUF2905 domain-containing protein [Bacillus kexueae]|uniref:DUF2905 domain-containing protein n=1 Tax=Aeribacillus kexueae TaxID=2078952 RepID=UPI001FAF6A23|nr:DUF2905 domain-containing protein [Bacillus kexueae]